MFFEETIVGNLPKGLLKQGNFWVVGHHWVVQVSIQRQLFLEGHLFNEVAVVVCDNSSGEVVCINRMLIQHMF